MPAYPSFRNGVVVQFPYTKEQSYLIQATTMDSGLQIANYIRADKRLAWEWLHQFNDTEVETFTAFVLSLPGKFGIFDFTPPPDQAGDVVLTYPNCRLDSDDIEIKHLGPNMHTAKVRIVQVNP